MKTLASTLFSLILLSSAGQSVAADLVWTNLAGGAWSSPANWSPNQVPGPSDTAVITQPGNYTVGLTANQSIGALIVGVTSGSSRQTLAVNGRNLVIMGSGQINAGGVLELNGGNLSGEATNRVDGVLNWSWGGFGGSITILLGAGGVLNIETANVHDMPSARLINEGLVAWNAGQIRCGQGSVIVNQGRWAIKANNQVNTAFGGEAAFNNQGLVEVLNDTAVFLVSGTSSGEFRAAEGTMCSFNLPHTFLDGAAFTGSGVNRLASGVFTLEGNIACQSLELLGGSVSGTHRLVGGFNWVVGTLNASSTTTIPAGSTLNIDSANVHDLPGHLLINEGVVAWNAGQVRGGQGSVIENKGKWIAKANNQINNGYGGNGVFNNLGQVEVLNDTTVFLAGGLSSGEFKVAEGALCSFHVPHTFLDGAAFTGTGVNRLASGAFTLEGSIACQSLELSGGSLSGTHRLVGGFSWVVGILNAGSTTTIPAGSTLSINSANVHDLPGHTLINEGVVMWNAGQVRGGQGSVIENKGRWIARADNQMNVGYGGSAAFNNPGVYDVQAGNALLIMPGTSTGTFNAAEGTISDFSSPYQFDEGTTFAGSGLNRLSGGLKLLSGFIHSENLQITGGSIRGIHTFDGTVNWVSGLLDIGAEQPGVTTIAKGSTLNILTGNLHDLPGHTLINQGTVVWVDGAIRNGQGSLIDNRGLWIARANNQINGTYGGASAFNNSGVFDVQSASVGFLMSGESTGTFNAGTEAVCTFLASYNYNEGTSFTGAGINRLQGGVPNLNGKIVSQNLEMVSGSLSGIHTFTGSASFAGLFTWIGGDLANAGTTTIAHDATLQIASGNVHDLPFHTLINNGTVVWSQGQIRGGQGASIQNNGLWLVQTDTVLDNAFGGAVSIFRNAGTFRKAGGMGTTTLFSEFSNSGTVDLPAGNLSLVPGNNTPYLQTGGATQLGGGRLFAAQGVQIRGGRLAGTGVVQANVVNSGVAAPGGSGVLTIQGDYTQEGAGATEFELGGTSPGVNYSRLNVTGRATLSGSANLRTAGGFVPAATDSFEVMSFGSRRGTFQCYNGFILLGHDRRLTAEYSPVLITLRTEAKSDPSGPILGINRLSSTAVLVCWPEEFPGYRMQSTENIVTLPVVWKDVSLTSSNKLILNPQLPMEFFRLVKP